MAKYKLAKPDATKEDARDCGRGEKQRSVLSHTEAGKRLLLQDAQRRTSVLFFWFRGLSSALQEYPPDSTFI